MTRLNLTTAQAKKLGLWERSTPAPEARGHRNVSIHHTSAPPSVGSSATGPRPVGIVEGVLGGHRHRWTWVARLDGFLSTCGIQMSVGQPREGEGVECSRCYEEVGGV